jgi:glycerate 2-kinase
MKILIAPDKLKGSLSAGAAAECIAAGVLTVVPGARLDLCPIADGGEGTVDALLKALGGRRITRRVTGPLPEIKVDAEFALLGDGTTAVIEMSAASGLALLAPEDRNPLNTTTFGAGELIAAAIAQGAKKILIGLGGSATIDAGIGMLQACGFTLLTQDGQPTSPTEPLCGRDLPNILMVKHGRGEITSGIEIIALADVTNPLTGPTGAAQTFGPQKGATPTVVHQLDAELNALARRTAQCAAADHPGAGAAGGLGFGILAYMNGSLLSGFDYIARAVGLSDRLASSDLCLTAEGRLDTQTACGKAVHGIARLCKQHNVPCIALVGSIAPDIETLIAQGLTAAFCICDGPMTLEQAGSDVRRLIEQSAKNCARLWAANNA